MSNRGSRYAGEESPGREVAWASSMSTSYASTSLGGGESRSAQYTGTKALMLAILEDGIRSYLSPMSRIRTEAEYWVGSAGSVRRFVSRWCARRWVSSPTRCARRSSACAHATSHRAGQSGAAVRTCVAPDD